MGTAPKKVSAAAVADVWSASAANGIPHFDTDASIKTQTFYSKYGYGVRFREKVNGVAYVYMPVSVKEGSKFSYIQIRAEASPKRKETAKAELIRIANLTGVTKVIGCVGTIGNPNDPTDGIQVRSAQFSTPETIDPRTYSYYIRVGMKREGLGSSPGVFDVMLSGRCHEDAPVLCPPPPPIPEFNPCNTIK